MVREKAIKAYVLKNAIEHKGEAASGAVINSLFNEGLKKEKIKETLPKIKKIINEINGLSLEVQKEEFKKFESIIGYRAEREGLPELPGPPKKVIARISPSPSGPFHIGHALVILPNFLYTEKYGGEFILRIEDTNPEKIYKPAYKMLEKEIKWLCNDKVKVYIQSERMEVYYKYIKKLIDINFAYICSCEPEKFKELILKKKACPCRDLGKKEQLLRWSKMLDKEGYKQGKVVVRFRSNLNDNNPAMRDFPLARINESSHPLQKKKYRVWPLMNLAVSVDDIEMKISHVIRGKDQKDNAKRQKLIYAALGKEKLYPYVAFIGRVHLKEISLSASKMREDVESGKYSGWEDKRLPTLASLKKQGYGPKTFYKFVEDRGISEVDKTISFNDLKEVLDNLQNQI